MSNLSDKELLEMMADFPKHELSTKQRTDMLKRISEAGTVKPRKVFNIQRLGLWQHCSYLLLLPRFSILRIQRRKRIPAATVSL